MKATTRFCAAIAVSAGLLASCADIKEINNRLDEFDGRITALETITDNLNANIACLQALYGGATINSATEASGVWTIVLSNEQTITLNQGSIGVGNAPIMSVDKDGYWMADYDGTGSEEPQYIMNGENKVLATGTSGKTPIFGVDVSGFWTVRYEASETPSQVLGADGQPVKALPDGGVQDPYFADVKVEDGKFKVTLRTGEELEVPIVPDFLCSIAANGVQTFEYGATKTYSVTMKGVASTMLSWPAGWDATLSEPAGESSILTVTAPASAPAMVKSMIADSRSDVSILAFSDQGLATIAKLSVSLSDAPVVINPTASVTAGTATENTLSYTIVLSDADAWKYIHAKKGETAPDAEKIKTDGMDGTGSSLTLEGLDALTTYVLYVLPVNGEKTGNVASAENTTLERLVTSYYEEWTAGNDITIGGVKFNKTMFAETEAQKVESGAEISGNGIWFIPENATVTYSGTVNSATLIIGDKPGKRAKVNIASQLNINNAAEVNYAVFHNIEFNASSLSTYILAANAESNFEYVIFDDCKIIPSNANSFHYNSNDGSTKQRGFENFIMVDSELQTPATQNNYALINAPKGQNYRYLTFRNNIIYSGNTNNDVKFTIWQGYTDGKTSTCSHLIFENNTLVNLLHNNGYLRVSVLNKVDIQNNLIFYNRTLTSDIYMFRPESTYPESGTIRNNIGHISEGTNIFKSFFAPANNKIANAEEINDVVENPFKDGTFDLTLGQFIPGAAYASYGAKR